MSSPRPWLVTAALLAACAGAPRPGGGPSADPDVATEREFRGQTVARVEELFVGRFPGVQVTRLAGGGLSVRIRGASTVVGSGEPLYVVDGMPVVVGAEGLLGLNPGDIARIEVLKDAGQIAEYGAQGANGVVRITTKRAR